MDCPQAQELIDLVLIEDPSVSVEARAAFDAHLEVCAACCMELEQSRRVVALVREHGRLSTDTIELLESHGEVVPESLWPELEDEPSLSEGEIEAGLARLMARIDEIEAQEAVEPKPMLFEEGVADLRRRVSTLEANQTPRRELWRRQWAVEDQNGSHAEPVKSAPTQSGALRAYPFRRRWRSAAGLAAAACLALVAVVWPLWQPDSPSPQQVARQADYSVELVTALGNQPLALGEPIRSEGGILELLLGRRHRVVLNHDNSATVTAEPVEGRNDLAWHVDLPAGEVYAEVVPGSRLAVATPNALATITGTKFNIRAQDEATELTLLKGSVRFISLAGGEPVDVIAGHASTVAARSAPTHPSPVDARLATAWARQALPGAERRMAERSLNDLNLLGDMQIAALVPNVPDYRRWNYERFCDEMRPWFAHQFPWAVELEKVLNEDHGIKANYLDVLMISGDIWQFRYLESGQVGGRIPAFHPEAVERVAHWYGLGSSRLMEAIGRDHLLDSQPEAEHRGDAFANAIYRWRDDDLRMTERGTAGDSVLFSLQASSYLHHTRAAAYLWVKEHPGEAERLLSSADYSSLFMTPLLPSVQVEPPLSVRDQLEEHLEACRHNHRIAQQRLVASHLQGCSVGLLSPYGPLPRATESLTPQKQEVHP